ncbi:hypothetical protein PF002_g27553 [Phytophthora fragariae]|nr:hypothetical protein PF006_g25639 [Phytophthora fragariae]KAE9180488.1 hypothetical protein PF002_g27553 [Phytophthora fragariae]KAE9277587.1 hypothetical protein PF001_g25581 [Phytophthora fragariae]
MQAYMHGEEDPHQIKLAQALQWCKQAWDDIPAETIKHCWNTPAYSSTEAGSPIS